MKKILLSSVALLSLVATLPVNSPVSAQESISPKAYSHSNGSWIQSNGRWWYKHSDGSYTKNGWEKINETWYYFDSEGWMKTGWFNEHGNWYYLDASGAMKTGWCLISGSWYYLNTSGVMQTGLQTIEGKQYYLAASGAMQTGWHNIGDDTYFFASSGARQTINRRALVLGETSTRAVPIEDVNAMEKVFGNQNFSKVVRFPDKTKSEIIAKTQELFKSSIESDVNYLYLTCHGGRDGRIYLGSDGQTFSGWELASILKQYKGKFVVMLDCCYSGTIIDVGKSDKKVASKSEEKFDEQAFLAGFSTGDVASKNGEMLDSKFLVLCASWKGEESYSVVGVGSLATRYWAMGTGWDSLQNRMISPMADTNTNGKITLEELYQYSYPLVLEAASQIHEEQHVSVYPKNSQFVLFQK
ncbi:pneumococcal surface protein A [Streptococcus pseudopneumoniae]|uniref:caspase family protein n=1 Tax=Streptococcus TaxID=1301 RepID=UPI0005E0FB03|nr:MULTISPECIES: caspase family protein [Streptococcus]TMR75246.1 peptidase C14 [Streptococcus pseudopneumoniae]CJY99604.1 pneumococcal surface protein A [Streptococcus pseudopneumoniae]COD04464.1 pneumococcal surface protein A [Streptococcus pseudopneumoniae]COO24349.1 pneumococcal surface protein A [Streptococcus pseudopneumoniae]